MPGRFVSNELVVGYPEFWPTAHNSFGRFFEVVFRLDSALAGFTDRRYEGLEPYKVAILYLGMLARISMNELITLAYNGFGQGAMKIARGMLEGAINAEYLRRFPAEFEDYLDWGWVESHKLLQYMQKNAPNLLDQVSPDNVQRGEQEFSRVRRRFAKRSSWCRHDLAVRAEKTDFQETYRLIYPLASRILHGSIGGLTMHLDKEEGPPKIEVPPSLQWVEQALVGGHLCALRMTQTLADALSVEPNPPIAKLDEDFHYAWDKKPAPTR